MEATWTKAAKVRRAFRAGRPLKKDRIVTPVVAIHEACILLDGLQTAMHEAGLPVEDVRAALVLTVPNAEQDWDFVHVLRVPEPAQLPDLFRRVADVEATGKVLPLGLGVWQRDREADSAVVWVQPFLTGPRAVRSLMIARQKLAEGQNGTGPA